VDVDLDATEVGSELGEYKNDDDDDNSVVGEAPLDGEATVRCLEALLTSALREDDNGPSKSDIRAIKALSTSVFSAPKPESPAAPHPTTQAVPETPPSKSSRCCVFWRRTKKEPHIPQDEDITTDTAPPTHGGAGLQLNGGVLLHIAVSYGAVRLAAWFILNVSTETLTTQLDALDNDGQTPLSLAATSLETIVRRFFEGDYRMHDLPGIW